MKNYKELLSVSPGLTAVIGSGGKTTLLRVLSKELPGRVLLSTSTHIRPFSDLPLISCAPEDGPEALLSRLRQGFLKNRVLCLGTPAEDGKLASPPVPFSRLLSEADYLLVEADGAAEKPMKAHASHEPVIPEGSLRTILVAGASAFFRPIREVCHRPEIFCRLTGTRPGDILTPELAAWLINAEGLPDLVFLNETDVLKDPSAAETFLSALRFPGFAGSLSPKFRG